MYIADRYRRIVTPYCRSLCGSLDHLKNHFYETINKFGLKTAHLLSLEIDVTNVNKSFGKELIIELKTVDNTSFIDVGSYSLHACKMLFLDL